MDRARADGATPDALEQIARQMESFKQIYDQPLKNAAITFLEPFPIGLLVTLITAAVLRLRGSSQSRPSHPPGPPAGTSREPSA